MTYYSGSVIIPAHNESAVIERCLEGLDLERGDLEVVVVANACSDDTAARARARGARVIETATPGKANALDLGDAQVASFPRAYLDADISISGADLRTVFDVLRSTGALAAAPRLQVDTRNSSWLVRAYYKVWVALPYVTDDLVGSGFYALSQAGRSRFQTFPAATGDDTFVRALFSPGERRGVDGTSFTVHPPRTVKALVAIKTRARFGVVEHDAAARTSSAAPASAGRRILRNPRLWAPLPVYTAIGLLTRRAARRNVKNGSPTSWARDATSRPGNGTTVDATGSSAQHRADA